jgi:hypothetical protein
MIEFTTRLENFNSSLWGHHIHVPAAVAKPFLEKENRRVVCTLNGELDFQSALMPKGDGDFFINVNKDIRKKLGLKEGMKVIVGLKEDDSQYGLPMPEEFGELLKQDEEGSALFHALTPGRQRALIHIAGSPKTSHTRLKKALVILEYLKSTGGKLDFKALNVAFRDANKK